MLTAADTFGAVEWRRVSGMNTVMTDYFALAPRHARDAILPIKHPLRTDDIHYIQAQKQTLLLYTAYDPRMILQAEKKGIVVASSRMVSISVMSAS